ncbi:kinase-like domain-containing protein [Pholiota molesta]|nr:kinase-like domain-containing protein [Pholiota molesta]
MRINILGGLGWLVQWISSLEKLSRKAASTVLCSGIINQGIWNRTEVAVKKLQNEEKITPIERDLRREIETWSTLRHPHILQFLGANVMDDEPFIVMPFIKRGNVRDYIHTNPQCDRVRIIHQISQGVVYLHSVNVIHGDLKGANVLIDDGERALLCDFGLSEMKVDVDSRSSDKHSDASEGSRPWMAPERLRGSPLRKPCDIYSLALTMYEIHSGVIPWSSLPRTDFREVVTNQRQRPERLERKYAPQLSDSGWELITRCWTHEPQDRPTISQVCAELADMVASSSTTVKLDSASISTRFRRNDGCHR